MRDVYIVYLKMRGAPDSCMGEITAWHSAWFQIGCRSDLDPDVLK